MHVLLAAVIGLIAGFVLALVFGKQEQAAGATVENEVKSVEKKL